MLGEGGEAGAFLGHWQGGLKQTGPDTWMALCPGHDDKKPSLSIRLVESKFIIKCHAGCRTEDVLAAKGLKMSDLFLNGSKPDISQRKDAAVYKYLGFEVVRTDPKGFYQRRSDGNGGYSYNLQGVTRTLYHNNELPAAIGQGTIIYICEGELDTDRLRSFGLVATCNSGGAGKWEPQYTTALKGADMVIIPDNDPPGKDHALKIAAACQATAKRVRILELPGLPPKGDVSDFLNTGDVTQLKALAEECPTWTPVKPAPPAAQTTGIEITLRRMKDVKVERVTWLWKPYMAIGKLTLLEGDPGIGKSWITLAIATAISLGKGLPGQDNTEPGAVILASAEDGLGDTIRPRLDSMKADVDRICAIDGAISFDDAGFTLIEKYIIDEKPRLLIIDPLVAYLGAGVDFHRANETRPVMARLAKLAEKYELAILAVRHLTKGGQDKAIYRGIGSIDFTAACRSVLMAGCDPDNPDNLGIVHIKSNLAAKGPSQGYKLQDDNFYWTGESSLTSTQIQAGNDSSGAGSEIDTAIEFLKEELADGPVPASNVYRDAAGSGISKRTLERAKKQMGILTGRLREKGKPGGGGFWTWQLPNDDLQCHHGDVGHEGVRNTYTATDICGDVDNFEAKNSTPPKNLAMYVTPEMVPDAGPPEEPPGLVATRANIVELWDKMGRPIIHLAPGENCEDIELILSHSDISDRNAAAVNKWYTDNGGI